MSGTNLSQLELMTALTELVSMSERQGRTLDRLMEKSCEEREEIPAPVVNVPAPNVNVAAPTVNVAAPAVQIVAKSEAPIIHVLESKKRKKVRLTVKRNDSGFIESMDIETLTED